MPGSRRAFLQASAGMAAAALLGQPGCCPKKKPGKYGGKDGGALRVRKNIMSLTETSPELVALRAGVAAMRARPASDPTGWQAQANIHNDHCPHGNWFFLPWHRAYLFYFEGICRAASGDDSFNLPYWNWTSQRPLPPAFWSGTLLDGSRWIANPGGTVTDAVV